ncbi:MAG TPA: glycogen debranching N-terminal domain-containing protein, partial [Thermoanaerobaculia bacterium]|nr:glycogen debranching N-terminal domain-containing protein [Thermoanaerobaculia bacterium]
MQKLIRVRPRPFTTHISRGRTVLATTLDGRIDGDPDHGLFLDETRVLSRWSYFIDGERPAANALSILDQNRWCGYFVLPAPGVTPPPRDTGSGQVPASSVTPLELQVIRRIDDALHEEIALTNHAMEPASFVFTIEVDADFADQAETRERQQQGTLEKTWDGKTLRFDYRNESLHRCIEIHTEGATYDDGRFSFSLTLAPKQQWRTTFQWSGGRSGRRIVEMPAPEAGAAPQADDVLATLEQARSDLAALRLFDLDHGDAWT